MARIKHTALLSIEYPVLEPNEFLWMAERNGLTKEQAKQLSGFSRDTWASWIYGTARKPAKIQREKLEKLYRIASDMGWINEGAIAA